MKYPNRLLVDCFFKCGDDYLIVKRKDSEKWFPSWYGSLWRSVAPNSNPYTTLQKLLDETGLNDVKDIKLMAVANNVFHDVKMLETNHSPQRCESLTAIKIFQILRFQGVEHLEHPEVSSKPTLLSVGKTKRLLDLKETFNVFLFVVEIDKKKEIKNLPEGEEILWINHSKLLKLDNILTEYKKVFHMFDKNRVLFYHCEYDFVNLLNFKVYNR